jgi:hypothetical protein
LAEKGEKYNNLSNKIASNAESVSKAIVRQANALE